MAAACTSMEVHDRRLAISKASASKISKPSPSPLLKSLSASASASASSPSSSPPRQLPSSITSSPSRPIAKVVNADPSSFRRVVQELTGTTPSASSPSSSPSAGASPRLPSRLQRIAPPPLRAAMRSSVPEHQQQTLLEQMQQQHHQALLLQQQNMPKVGPLSSPPLSFPDVSSSNPNLNICNSTPQFGKAFPNPGSEPAPQLENTNFSQSLPMLSPHLLSPLPALTPGDSTWASPIDLLAHSPKFMPSSTSNPLPPLLPLPNFSTSSSINGYSNGLLAKPAYTSMKGLNDVMSTRPPLVSRVANSLVTSQGQPLPPLLSTPLQTMGFNGGVLPPWSPSPLPYSPGSFPPSPGLGPPTLPQGYNGHFSTYIKYGSNNFNF